ncbi:endonuclease VII domain-containing protein [Paenibacillus cymbidii]|uniref:endonuclease VII domain-containing protein n=1 Tax=Paenibacillus cymbidii TaxID=1639034 RepID=UPI0038B37E9C
MTSEERRKRYQKEYYEKNKKRLLELQRIRNKKNYQDKKEVYNQRSRAWREANPERTKKHEEKARIKHGEKLKKRSADWYLNNKETARRQTRQRKLKKYGLTEDDYQALLVQQNYRCAICGSSKALEKMNTNLYVDHCHKTGGVRGLLCQKCNAGLGMFKESLELIKRAAVYLNNSSSGATLMKNKSESK